MKFSIGTLLLLGIFACISFSCSKKDDIPVPTKIYSMGSGMTVLGYQLLNPYSVSNMTTAYNNIHTEDTSIILTISPNFIYVRFLPQNDQEYDTLAWNSSLELFEYPLDYTIVHMGDYYHDPSVSDSNFTYQYSVLPLPVTDPGVAYEILDYLFIPDRERCEIDPIYDAFIDKLENAALILTNNLEYDNTERTYKLSNINSGFNPEGIIHVFDNTLNQYVPVEGAKVRANRWFETRSSLTNSTGYFKINNKFKKPVNYSIKWETNDYDIREGNWGQATTNGPKTSSAWALNITESAWAFMFATIHRAAYTYYYNNTLGIQSPPKQVWYRSKIKIAGHHKDDDVNGDWNKARNWITYPHIRIYESGGGSMRTSENIIYTTCHELAHGSHWDLCVQTANRNDFTFGDDKVLDSWALGIGWGLTNSIYNITYGQTGYSYLDGYQGNDINIGNSWLWNYWNKGYTPLVIDLFDDINQRANESTDPILSLNYPPDNITGFSFLEIENSLKGGVRTLDQWKANLKTLNKVPSTDLDVLFDFYKNLIVFSY